MSALVEAAIRQATQGVTDPDERMRLADRLRVYMRGQLPASNSEACELIARALVAMRPR
jgi:hypothetical protein